MKHRETFEAVLGNGDDQVTVRAILSHVLTAEQKEEVVSLFNQHADEYNQRREKLGI